MGELPTLTYILVFSLVLVISFVIVKALTIEMVIKEVVEAKYKAD